MLDCYVTEQLGSHIYVVLVLLIGAIFVIGEALGGYSYDDVTVLLSYYNNYIL